MGERPHAGTAETVAPQDPHAWRGTPGQQPHVPALIDKVCRRKHLERAWEKGKQNRGSAGSDDVTIAPLEARQEASLARRHRKRRDGTSRPPPVTRVEIPTAAGGVRQLGLPAVLERVGQQALGQRREGIFEPTGLDSSCGYRPGRSPPEARRTVWQAVNAGEGWIVEADWRQFFDTMAQETRLDLSAEARSDGRALPRGRDVLRAGVRAGGGWKPPWTGVPQGGVASPLWSNSFLTPFDRRRAEAGRRLTRGAADFVGWCQTREEAQRAVAMAERALREERGVERQPQKTRLVHVSQGFACLG